MADKAPMVLIKWKKRRVRALNEMNKPRYIHGVTVGFLIQDNEDFKVLAPHGKAMYDEKEGQLLIRIPTPEVKEIWPLRLPRMRYGLQM